jgi:hypothetical protein
MAIEIDEISERLGEIGGTLRAIQRQIDSMLVEQVRVQEGQRKIESGQLEIAIGASKRDDKTLLVERQITEISASLGQKLTSQDKSFRAQGNAGGNCDSFSGVDACRRYRGLAFSSIGWLIHLNRKK